MTTEKSKYWSYRIVHSPTGLVYFGSTGNVRQRFSAHRYAIRNCCHSNIGLRQLSDDSELSDFSFEKLACFGDYQGAFDDEQERIRLGCEAGNCLNILISEQIGGGGDALTNHPERALLVAKRAAAQRAANAQLSTQDRKLKYGKMDERNGMFGRTHSDAVKARLSEVNRGNTYAKGAVRSEKHRKRLSQVAKLRVGELNPFWGKKHSATTKAKIAEYRRGKSPANCKKVQIEGVVYSSCSAAAKALGVSPALITYRLKSDKYDYKFCE